MKKRGGVDITEKVVIVHMHGVSEQVKEKYQKAFPNANVKVVAFGNLVTEAEFKTKVNYVICMPEIAHRINELRICWQEAQIILEKDTKLILN